jgi:hypothetical protein
MSQTIKTYKDLCDERVKVKSLLVIQRERVRADWQQMKDEFLPLKNAIGVMGKFTTRDKTNPLVNAGLKVASDLLLKNFVLAKAGWVTKLAVPFVVKNYSSHLLVNRGASFLGKVVNIFSGKKRRTRNIDTQSTGARAGEQSATFNTAPDTTATVQTIDISTTPVQPVTTDGSVDKHTPRKDV